MNVHKEIVHVVDIEKHIEVHVVPIYVLFLDFGKVKEIDDDSL